MSFIVEPAIFARFPGLRIAVAVADGIDNALPRPAILAAWQAVWHAAGRDAARHGNAQSHPRVRPWRERFRAMGVSGKTFPSSIEALVAGRSKATRPLPSTRWSISTIPSRYAISCRRVDSISTRCGDHWSCG